MDIMLIAIAAVVIIAIIAGVVMMKKKGSPTDTPAQKPTNRPKTLAEQQRERELQNQANANTPANLSSTPMAAGSTPTPSVSQTLAQPAIHATTSANTADTPSALSMTSVAAPVAVAATAVTATAAHTMRETAPTATTSPQVTPLQSVSPVSGGDSIDFDDFDIFKEDSKSLAEVTQPTLSTTPAQPATDVLDFDLDLDHDSHSVQNTIQDSRISNVIPEAMPTHTTTLENDYLSLETNDEDISFDLSDAIARETKLTQATITPTALATGTATTDTAMADDSFDFDDIDLELPMLATVSNAGTHTTTTDTATKADPMPTASISSTPAPVKEDFAEFEDFGEFDLTLDPPAKPSLTSAVEPVMPTTPLSTDDIIKNTTAKNEAVMLGDDDFNFNFDDSLSAKDTATTIAPTVDTHTKPNTATTSAEPSMAVTGLDDTFDQLDAFYAPTHSTPTHEPVVTTPALVPDTVSHIVSSTTPQPTQLVDTQAPVIMEDFSHAFEVIKGMDSQQVTLTLAEQYIQLGEYDSAKRLLNELIAANPAVQQTASRLLANLE